MLTVGAGELEANTRSLVDSFGRPISNAEETFQKTATTAASQQVISQAGRAVVVLLALLSAVGLFRLWRRNAVNPPLLIMAARGRVRPSPTMNIRKPSTNATIHDPTLTPSMMMPGLFMPR